MKFFTTIFTIWQREIIRYWRDKTRIISTFIQPLMFLAIFGLGLQKTLAAGNFGVDFLKFMYPGILCMSVMGVAFFSTISTVWDREFGFLKEILVAPVSRSAIATGKTLGATTIASIQALLLLVLAPFIGVNLNLTVIAELFGLMLLLALAISGLGLLISSLMKTTESFGLLMQLLIFPLFFLSGAFFPLTNVPVWMEWISKLDPLTYGVDALRRIMLSGEVAKPILDKLIINPVSVNVLYLASFAVVMVLLAVLAFRKKA